MVVVQLPLASLPDVEIQSLTFLSTSAETVLRSLESYQETSAPRFLIVSFQVWSGRNSVTQIEKDQLQFHRATGIIQSPWLVRPLRRETVLQTTPQLAMTQLRRGKLPNRRCR